MRSSGWKYESHRHMLAAKGISTGRRAYLSKGNRSTETFKLPDGQEVKVKSILATPIGKDPVTGQFIYPTKADLGLPLAERKSSVSSDAIMRAIEENRSNPPQQPDFAGVQALPQSYMTRPVQPMTEQQQLVSEIEKEEAPQEIALPSDDRVVDEEELSLDRKNAFDRSVEVGSDKIPVPVTPGAPMYTGGM